MIVKKQKQNIKCLRNVNTPLFKALKQGLLPQKKDSHILIHSIIRNRFIANITIIID